MSESTKMEIEVDLDVSLLTMDAPKLILER